jgi:hypothetical protein
MSVFNPKMLDASIRDIADSLSNNDKTSVLLYAMERLPLHAEYVSYGKTHIGQDSPINIFLPKDLERRSRTGSSPVSRSRPCTRIR